MKTFFFVMLALLFFNAEAQEYGYLRGYIVTNNNDTILGMVKNKNLAPFRILQEIKFKPDGKDQDTQHYTADQLISFQAGENLYVSKPLVSNDGTVSKEFWEVLIDGQLALYELKITGLGTHNTTTYRILQRQGENRIFSVFGSHFNERLLAYFANDPDMIEKIKAKRFKISIADLVKGI